MIPLIILSIENDDDRNLLITLYTDLYPMMKAVAMKIVKDNDVAEDVIQDAVAMLIAKIDVIRDFEDARLKSYVNRAVYRTAINCYQKHKREEAHSYYDFDRDIEDYVPDTSSTPQEHIELREEYVKAGKAMELLPERERELLYQKYYLQYSDEAISKAMDIKKDSVRTYLSRARSMLRDFMLKEGVESE